MKLVAPPLYVLYTQTLDKQKGVDVLTGQCPTEANNAMLKPLSPLLPPSLPPTPALPPSQHTCAMLGV